MKSQLRELLANLKFDEIAALAVEKRRVLHLLVSLTFDADPLIAWRAVDALGRAAERVAAEAPGVVRNHLRRLHWLISEESGGVCWHAPEAMAEIVRRKPDAFADYVPIIASLLQTMEKEDLVRFRAGILRAIGRLAHLTPKQPASVLDHASACLDDTDPQVRGMAVWCLGQLGRPETRKELLSDEGEVLVYEDGELVKTSVGDLARQAVKNH
jgi:HEAT repeat protein